MKAISVSMPGIHINGPYEISILHVPDSESSPTGEMWFFDLDRVRVYVTDLEHLEYLAAQIFDYCDAAQREKAVAV